VASLPEDPLQGGTLADFARRLRRGEISAESATRAYLERIALLGRVNAFVHVAADRALEQARAMDRLLAAGTDLGPLMGVPVAVKDLLTVDGMPLPTCGSRVDIAELVQPEGEIVRRLKRAGCVLLGKTRMTEFAFGLVNLTHPTPWNPADPEVHRMTGGSSNGSAAALAAGLCAFSIGSDTGGSVRQPAALCGLFGYKGTYGLWPTDGAFPLSTTMDSIGAFTHSAEDGALVFSALTEADPHPGPLPKEREPFIPPRAVRGLRLGRPDNHFFEGLSRDVAESTESALERLEAAGAQIVPIEVPEAGEIDSVFGPIVSIELLATLGRERFVAAREALDPIVWNRAQPLLDFPAVEYARLLARHRALVRIAAERMRGLDGWVMPTAPEAAPPLDDYRTPEKAAAWIRRHTHNTRPGNLFGQCAVSIALPGTALPVGLQVAAAPGGDATLLSIAQGVEQVIGRRARIDASRLA
jgi:aspartyl-tRNA(Asn)/glutamyl-tRNA(Gln) amidotransferase subunit A